MGGERAYKSPHNAMSKIKLCGLKKVLMSQPVLGQFAVGSPRVDVSKDVALPLKAAGTLVR